MKTKLNIYNCISDPEVKKNIDIQTWFEAIKYPKKYLLTITEARLLPKKERDAVKVKNVPAITYNFLFDKYKNNSNIISSTGYMYIDIDDISFNINILDKNKVYAYYHSFSGIEYKYGIVVKVKGLTLFNFSIVYNIICEQLKIEKYIDKNAIKASQYSVLSYDPNIFINNDCIVFDAIQLISNCIDFDEECISSVVNKKETYTTPIDTPKNSIINIPTEQIQHIDTELIQSEDIHIESELIQHIRTQLIQSTKYRFDNLNEYAIEGDYAVDWEGKQIIKCWIPWHKITQNKTKVLMSYANNFVYLNTQVTLQKLFEILKKVNNVAFFEPFNDLKIMGIANSIIKYRDNNTLRPIYFAKLRKIFFNTNLKMTAKEKFEICRFEIAEHRKEISLNKIYNVIEAWDNEIDGKISLRKISKKGNIAVNTIVNCLKRNPELTQFMEEMTKINNL